MKQLKAYFKFTMLFTAITFMVASCQKEDDTTLNDTNVSKQKVKIETVNKAFIDKHQGIKKILEAINIKNNSKTDITLQREVHNEHFDFIVDTENAIYIDSGDRDSFIFTMLSNNTDVNVLENFVLHSKQDGTYQANIYQYSLANYNFENHIENDNITGFTKIILPDDLDFANNVLSRSADDPCVRNYYQSATYSGYLTEDDCNSLPEDAEPCEYSHQVVNYSGDCGDNVPHYSEGDGGGYVYIEIVYVFNPTTGQYEEWYPDNSTGTGSGIGNNNNNGNNTQGGFATLPYIDYAKHVAKTLGVAPTLPNAQADIYDWVMNPNNIGSVKDIFSFIVANDYSQEVKDICFDILNILTTNPNLSFEEAQILAVLAIENNADIDDLIYVIENEQDYRNQMSDDELNLFDTLSYEQQVLYLLSAKQALDKTNELFPTPCERYNGKGDAFRHAYWNALSSQRIGVGLTNLLTTRHENRPPLYAYDSKETEMDLFNNQVGRDIVYNGMTNLMLIQQAVQDALSNGDLRYLTNLNPNIGPELCRATFNSQLVPTN